MRILFAGGTHHSVDLLRFLLLREEKVVAILTQPATSLVRGRRMESPFVTVARETSIPLLQPSSLRSEAREVVASYTPDILVCVAYGRIFGPRFLALFPHGGINVHPSLLPKYRGPSPVQAAILAGDQTTGVSIQTLAEGMDQGDILLQEQLSIGREEGRVALESRCFELGKRLIVEVLQQARNGNLFPRAQDEREVSYCSRISREDGLINWHDSALQITRKFRAYEEWPGIYSMLGKKRLKLLAIRRDDAEKDAEPGCIVRLRGGIHVQTGNGRIIIKKLQLEGKNALDWDAFLRGQRDLSGKRLGV